MPYVLYTVTCLLYVYVKNFSSPKTIDKHYLCIFVYSTSVKILGANVIGLLFCSNAASKPYALASVWDH